MKFGRPTGIGIVALRTWVKQLCHVLKKSFCSLSPHPLTLTALPLPLLWFFLNLVEGNTVILLRARPSTITCSQHCRQLQVHACCRKMFLCWRVDTAPISSGKLGLTGCIPLLNTLCISVINTAIFQLKNLSYFTWPFPQPILACSQSLQHIKIILVI